MIPFFILLLKIVIAGYMALKLALVALTGAFFGALLRRLRQLRRGEKLPVPPRGVGPTRQLASDETIVSKAESTR